MRLIAFVGLILAVVGCGGGGGSDSGVPFWGGVYDVKFEVNRNTCGQNTSNFERTLTVNQDDTRIVVDDPLLGTFLGTATDVGWEASSSARVEPQDLRDPVDRRRNETEVTVRLYNSLILTALFVTQLVIWYRLESGATLRNASENASIQLSREDDATRKEFEQLENLAKQLQK